MKYYGVHVHPFPGSYAPVRVFWNSSFFLTYYNPVLDMHLEGGMYGYHFHILLLEPYNLISDLP